MVHNLVRSTRGKSNEFCRTAPRSKLTLRGDQCSSNAIPQTATLRRILLGSSALIGIGLIANPAAAQTTVPAGSGTITATSGASTGPAPGTDNGVSITGGTSNQTIVTNAQVTNISGIPTVDAVHLEGTADIVFLGTTNYLRTDATGGAALYAETANTNLGVNLTNFGNTFIGSYGIRLSAPSGPISLDSTGRSQTIQAAGSAVTGIELVAASNAELKFGTSAISGFATGVRLAQSNASGFTVFSSTGGSISATTTGIRAEANAGSVLVTSQTAIAAPIGIDATSNGNIEVTTSGGGTINGATAGIRSSAALTGKASTITVGAAIGGTTRPTTGVSFVGTGVAGGTNTVNANANISAGTNAISVSGADADLVVNVASGVAVTNQGTGDTISASRNITIANAGTIANIPNTRIAVRNSQASSTIAVTNSGTMSGSGVLYSSGTVNLINSGAITATNYMGVYGRDGTVLNNVGGTITGGSWASDNWAIRFESGGTLTRSITNNGTITGGSAGSINLQGGDVTLNLNAGSVTNGAIQVPGTGTVTTILAGRLNGTYDANAGNVGTDNFTLTSTGVMIGNQTTAFYTRRALNLTNAGSITGGTADAVHLWDAAVLTLVNSGTITPTNYAGVVIGSPGTHSIANSGTIRGGTNGTYGWGVSINAGDLTINNNSGGTPAPPPAAAIRLNSTGTQTVNLNAGSTVTGTILAVNSGTRNVTVAGLLTGAYSASGTGADTVTLASTGSITGAIALGDGGDVFNWQGGSFGSTIDGGAGINYFNVQLGAGNAATLAAANLPASFYQRDLQSGTLTLTGSSTGSGNGWQIQNGTTLNFATTAFNVVGGSYAVNAYGGTVNVLAGATVSGANNFAATFNSANPVIFNNAGTISVDGNVFLSNGSRIDVTNSGTMTATSYGGVAFSSGGGTLTNTGTITGGSFILSNLGTAVRATTNVTINNNGSGIIQTSTGGPYAILLGNGGGTINNQTGAIIRQAATNRAAGIYSTGATTITNAGAITTAATAGSDGITVLAKLTLTNSGTISSADASGVAYTGLASALTNTGGTIAGGSNVNYGYGVQAATGSTGTLVNASNGLITGGRGGTLVSGTSLTINNSAVIRGTDAASYGIRQTAGALTLNNSSATGVIAGLTNGLFASGGSTTITNSGTIGSGTTNAGAFVAGGDGNAILLAAGTITNSGLINGAAGAIRSTDAAGILNLTNTGTIISRGVNNAENQDGLFAGGAATVLNAGTISSAQFAAIIVSGAGSVTNAAAGTLTGGVRGSVGVAVNFDHGGTFTNYGQADSATGNGFLTVSNLASTVVLAAGSTTGSVTTAGGDDILAIYSGRGTAGQATTDVASGIVLQNAGTLAAATFGTIDLGAGTDTLQLRGAGDGTAGNGTAGALDMSIDAVFTAEALTKLDSGTWTLTGPAAQPGLRINAGTGGLPGSAGLLIFAGTTGLAGDIYVNAATIRATTADAFGTGTIHTVDPTVQFAATGTYANAISLEAVDIAGDPTVLQTFGTNITATLGGAITQASAGQPVVFSSVDANGVANAGTFVLTNTANAWTGATTIAAGTTLQVATNTLSGSSVANAGTLAFNQNFDGAFAGSLSGAGTVQINGATTTQAITLSGTNANSGATNIVTGTLIASGGAAIGDTSTVDVATGATLQLANSESIGGLSGSGTARILANSLMAGGNNASTTFAGTITDQTPVAYVGSWTVSDGAGWATNPPTYTGQEAAALLFGGSAANYRTSTAGISTASITDTSWYNRYGNSIYLEAASNFRIDTGGAGYNAQGDTSAYVQDHTSDPHINYAFTGGVALGGGLTKTGTGTLTLSGTNNYTGLTSVLAGTLAITGGAAIADTGAVSVGAGATFAVLASETIGQLNGAGATTLATGSTLTLSASSGSYGGAISGAGAVGVSGTLALGGASVNSGGFTVAAGTTLTVAAGGSIATTGAAAITGAAGSATIVNSGAIGASGTAISLAAGSVTNQTNGLITGANGISAGGTLTLVNQTGATIRGTGTAISMAAGTVSSAGSIESTGGVAIDMTGNGTITNQAGGMISGALGAITVSSSGTTTINLNAGSITNGRILVAALGTRNVNVAGALNGAYDASSGNGIDTITLAATGSMTSANLGGGNDSFAYAGGTISGVIDAGSGSDAFTASLGTGASGALSLTSLVNFESFTSQSGNLTLTGTRSSGPGWVVNGGTLALGSAALSATTGNAVVLGGANARLTVDGASTVRSSGYAVIANAAGASITNSGTLLGSGIDLSSAIHATRDLTLVNSGLIDGILDPAATTQTEGVHADGALTLANHDSGTIRGGWVGVRGLDGGTIVNAGTLTGNVFAGAELAGAFAVTNQDGGTIGGLGASSSGLLLDGGAIGVTNQAGGTITAEGVAAIYTRFTGSTAITNGGVIQGSGTAGGILAENDGVLTIANRSGGLIASANGIGINIAAGAGAVTITNEAGGTIGGGLQAISIATAGAAAIDLQAGSITNGDIASSGGGDRTVSIAGTLNGSYVSTGTGVDTVTMRAGSSLVGGDLGDGDDVFNYYGGAIAGIVSGGNGTDLLNGDFGAGTNTTVTLANFTNFETFGFVSGDVTITGPSASPAAAIYARNGGTVGFTDTQGNTGDIYIDGGNIRANTAGAFGTGTIHFIDPTAFFGATGTYANNLSLEVQSPATADPSTLSPDAGVVATLTGAITQGTGAGVDANQPLVISGAGTIVLTNTANLWSGTTTINTGATLQGASGTISGSNIAVGGTLAYVQPGSGTVAQNISGIGTVRISGLAAGETLNFAGTNSVGGFIVGDASAIANSGTISGQVALVGGGTFINSGTGAALSNSGALAGTFNNSGTLTGGVLNTGALTVTNTAGGTIANGIGSSGAATATTLVNAGSITSGGTAISVVSGSLNLTNQAGGSIIATAGNGIGALGAATVSNLAGGVINATAAGGWGIDGQGSTLTATNAGTINADSGVVKTGGTGTFANSGTINAATNGILTANGGTLAVTNTGTIASSGDGVQFVAGGSVVIDAGAISGAANGIRSSGGALSVTNNATLSGGTYAIISNGAFADTVTLGAASTTIGIVDFGAGNDALTLVAGAAYGGLLDGGADLDALALAGTGNASLDIGTVINFESRAMNGTGVWTLTGTDASAADWQITAGTLALSGGLAVNDAAGVTIAASGKLRLDASERFASLNGTGSVDLGANMLTLGTGGDYAGVIGGTGNLVLAGGALTLRGANTYTGVTLVSAGTLTLGASGVLANASILLLDTGAILDLQGNSETVAGAILYGDVNGTGTLTAAGYQLNGATINANLGAGTLAQLGGISTLNGIATAGTIDVQAGTLVLGASDRLADSAAVGIAAGAVLDLGAFSDTVGTLALGGTLAGSGTLTAASYALTGATVNANLGAGALASTGASTLNGSAAAATVNVTAGTLALGAADGLADTATLVVAAGATFDLGAFSDTVGLAALSGTLAGTGTLHAAEVQLSGATVNANLGAGALFNTGGTSTLNGTSGANLVVAQAGTLQLGAAERLADTTTLAINTGATFDLAGYTETVGTLSGTGTLALGAGRLVLAGSTDSAFGGALIGAGSLDKQGSGRLTLAGAFAATGRFDATAGVLAFDGTSAGSMRVQGGTLIGQGALAGTLAIASGTFSPGGLVGANAAVQPIGSFQAQSLSVTGGTLLFDFGGANLNFASDTIRVTGPALLSGGTVNVTALSTTAQYAFQQEYTIVQAASLTGTFANGASFANVGNDAGLKWRLRYDLVPNAVVLQVQKQLDFAAAVAGGSPNQLAIGNALNGAAGTASDQWAATLNTIAALTPAQRGAAYDSIGGEAIADASSSTIMANTLFLDLLRGRIGDGQDQLSGTGFARSALGDVRVATTQGNSLASRLAAQGGDGRDGRDGSNGGGVWGQAYGGLQKLSGLSGQSSLETTAAGIATGAEGRIGSLTFGIAGGYTEITGDVNARNATLDGRLVQAGGYASYDDGAAFVNLAGNHYWGKFDTLRLISLGSAVSSASGRFENQGYSVGVTAGYRADLGGGLRAVAIASATQTHDSQDAFTERAGGGLGLASAAAKRDLFTATGELRLGQWIKTGAGSAMPYVSLGVRYNAGDLDTLGNMRFAGAPTGTGAFQVRGAKMASLLGTFGAGIDVKASERVSLGIAVENAYADRVREGRASMRIRIGF